MKTLIKIDELRPIVSMLNRNRLTYGKAVELITECVQDRIGITEQKETWARTTDLKHVNERNSLTTYSMSRSQEKDYQKIFDSIESCKNLDQAETIDIMIRLYLSKWQDNQGAIDLEQKAKLFFKRNMMHMS